MLLDPAGAPCCAARTSLQVEPGPAHQGRSQVSGAGDPPLAAAGGPSHHRAEACPLRQTRQDWAAQCGSCDLKRGPPSLSQVGLARGPHSLLAPLMRVPGCPMPPPHYVPLSHFLLGNKRSSWVPSKETQQVSCLPRGPLLCPGGPPEPAWWGHRGGSSGLLRLRAHPGVDGVVQGLRARELGPRPRGTSPPGQAEALVPTAPRGQWWAGDGQSHVSLPKAFSGSSSSPHRPDGVATTEPAAAAAFPGRWAAGGHVCQPPEAGWPLPSSGGTVRRAAPRLRAGLGFPKGPQQAPTPPGSTRPPWAAGGGRQARVPTKALLSEESCLFEERHVPSRAPPCPSAKVPASLSPS